MMEHWIASPEVLRETARALRDGGADSGGADREAMDASNEV